MKQVLSLNECWAFKKDVTQVPETFPIDWEFVDLPHTWNAADGQDGGADYWRGTCCYMTELEQFPGKQVYLEVLAASSSAKIFVNGLELASHEGGYSTFRVDITDDLTEETNLIAIQVDNSANDRIYPQTADFTFYGGLYRGVNLVLVENSHFDLDFCGGNGFTFSADVDDETAIIFLDAYVTNPEQDGTVTFTIQDALGKPVAEGCARAAEHVSTRLRLEQPHLWQGVEDPYLYTVTASLSRHNEVLDQVSGNLGIRSYYADPQKGFFLNGKLTPLRGVSRHQDFLECGNALTKEQHERDVELIREVGANTVRLAHYQHSQDFYDACDKAGLIVWAEIPFISVMSKNPDAHKNCRSQMKELITQNYNHPSICYWGISNEITIGGERPGLVENLKDLNDLAHSLDATRPTTMAQVSHLPMENVMNQITDVVSYNHYFGWYTPGIEKNEQWLDAFHAMYPDRALGISEYGAEGIITYHSDDPKCKDYTEEYQAIYHEHMAKVIDERPWLWATHVWNMFDFGCDARDEGGVKGRNNKGLMTMDRKIRKDSFYLYKAYWSDEPFVHLCEKRYAERANATTAVKVYSNQPKVTLSVNGKYFADLTGSKVFEFDGVPLDGLTMITATAGDCSDSMTLKKVDEPNPSYVLIDEEDNSEAAANWFNVDDYKDVTTIEIREGFFSIKDTVGAILENEQAGDAFAQIISATTGMQVKKSMLFMMKDMPVEAMGAMSGQDSTDMMIAMNEVLNKIPKN